MSPMKCKSRGAANKLSLDLTTWPPKLKRLGGSSGDEDDATRPRTATLDKPRVLDADLLGRIDMTRITRRGLLALAGIVAPGTTEQTTPRKRTHRLNRTFRVPALSCSTEECFVRPVIGEDVPQPCRTCGRAELPERLHSHPVNKVREEKAVAPAPCAVKRPVPIKYRPKGNLPPPKEESPVRSPIPGKGTRKKFICYICGRDIGSTPLEFHEPTCLTECVATGTKAKCSVNEFLCSDGMTCIHKSWVCDSDEDCIEGEDESPEHCTASVCREDQFKCHNNLCIPGHMYCSGKPECTDGSDEWNCTDSTFAKCDVATHFDCGGGLCIPWAKVCDGKRDCPDATDEPGPEVCNKNECATKNGGCVHNCHDTPNGFYCSCKKGYQLSNDSKTCDDVNECDTPGVCSQICINERGRFKCECVSGYLRDHQNPTRCKAGEGHASLLFARRHDIRKISLDHHDMTSIVNDTSAATALDYVFRTGMIFWSDFRDMKIYKAPIDEGSQRKMVISDDMTTVDGLAVDWIYNHLYWTDTKKKTIELANFEGNMRKTVLNDNLYEPRSIAVNPLDGWMYWTDWGKAPKIERGGMDGSHRMTIVSHKLSWPNGLTLDLVGKRVFWVDAKQKLISSCNYDGSERRVVLHSEEYLGHPFSITTFEDYIFWTDWDKKAIFKAIKFNGANVTSVSAQMLKTPMAIHVYHPYRQPDGMNYCTAVNGHCSHLCLPAPIFNKDSPKFSCACPDGLHLRPDGLICVEKGTTTANVTTEVGWNGVQTNGNIYTIIICLSGLLVLIALAMVFVYKRYQNRNVTSMNFDNPVYRKTTEDQFALEKSQYQPSRNFPTTTIGEESGDQSAFTVNALYPCYGLLHACHNDQTLSDYLAQEPLTSPGTSDYV